MKPLLDKCVHKRIASWEINVGFVCRVCTVSEVSGRQLKVHYDGWPDEYDWWFDDDSPDIHPTSWCSKTGHPLMPPLSKSGELSSLCWTLRKNSNEKIFQFAKKGDGKKFTIAKRYQIVVWKLRMKNCQKHNSSWAHLLFFVTALVLWENSRFANSSWFGVRKNVKRLTKHLHFTKHDLNLLQLRKRSNVLRVRPSARPPDAVAWDTSKAISTRLTVASTTAPIRPETSGPQSRPSRTDSKPRQPEQCPLH